MYAIFLGNLHSEKFLKHIIYEKNKLFGISRVDRVVFLPADNEQRTNAYSGGNPPGNVRG